MHEHTLESMRRQASQLAQQDKLKGFYIYF